MKNGSERSRTPGRPSPESHSAQGSPREDSPPDNASAVADEKKPDNNSNSNEGTLVGPANSDETVLATEYRKSKSDNRIRRSKSARSSRASTPGPVGEIHHAEVQILPCNEIMEIISPLEIKQSDLLELPKRKEKSPSPYRQNSHPDTEEPSFANTLDDIATMGTNEVADLDPYMDERPLSALPVNIDDIQQFIPTVQYIEPLAQKEEVNEIALVSEHEDFIVEKANSNLIKVEINDTQVKHERIRPKNNEADQQPQNYESVQEPPNEIIAITQITEEVGNKMETEYKSQINDNNVYGDKESHLRNSESYNVDKETTGLCEKEVVNDEKEDMNNGSLEDINIQQAESIASSIGMESAQLERQFTPLSFSSSDAAFYSPTDSPDESMSDKLKDMRGGSQTQVNICPLYGMGCSQTLYTEQIQLQTSTITKCFGLL